MTNETQLKCYEFDDGGGISFCIAHTDEASARTFAEKQCDEEVANYQVKEISLEEMERMPLHDEDVGPTTMAEYFSRHNKQFPGQPALLSHSEI